MPFIATSKEQAEAYEAFIDRLDSLRHTAQNASDEYGQELRAFEEEFGEEERERYEEKYV